MAVIVAVAAVVIGLREPAHDGRALRPVRRVAPHPSRSAATRPLANLFSFWYQKSISANTDHLDGLG